MSKLGLVVLDNNNKNKIQIDTHLSVKSNKQVRLGCFRQQNKIKIKINLLQCVYTLIKNHNQKFHNQ